MPDLSEYYGPGAKWSDPDVQDDMKNRALAVFRRAVDGKKVSGMEMKAAETLVSKGILRDPNSGPKQLTVIISEDKLLEAKRKAGLLTE